MTNTTINNQQQMDLNERLLKALTQNPQTDDVIIEVVNENGLITLMGEVDSPETRQAVEQIVANEPGVITVINQLKVDRGS